MTNNKLDKHLELHETHNKILKKQNNYFMYLAGAIVLIWSAFIASQSALCVNCKMLMFKSNGLVINDINWVQIEETEKEKWDGLFMVKGTWCAKCTRKHLIYRNGIWWARRETNEKQEY